MKNLDNKITYQFLEQWSKKSVLEEEDYVIRKSILGKKYGAFKEDKDGEKIYGYYQDNFFSFHICKENLSLSHLLSKVIWPLVVSVFIFILFFGIYTQELELFDTTFKIILGATVMIFLSFIGILFIFYSIKNIGGGTTIHYLKKDGTETIMTEHASSELE